MVLPFDNSYARLPEKFFSLQDPVPVPNPKLITLNLELAETLGLNRADLTADVLAGNALPEGATPLAQVYSGHQFGNWAGQLGDGRAVLLGELVSPNGHRFDMTLKGAGRTPYSRGGDGRAWLGPVLREYIVSEAMFALGVPTTRALAAVSTGEDILREETYPGAILTRIAASHIRVGTFQHFAAKNDLDGLKTLLEYTLTRHYPDVLGAEGLLRSVVLAQAKLVAKWMGYGFIHGVMNTDNTTLSGETIDYGPCAFMDGFDPGQVFSSIDQMERYAWDKQPDMALWNLAQLATCLLPLMDDDPEIALDKAHSVLDAFREIYAAEWVAIFSAKIGLRSKEKDDSSLIQGLLSRMAASRADFTTTFRELATDQAGTQIADPGAWASWEPIWRARLEREGLDFVKRMQNSNPAVIPRNHQIEAVISAALAGDLAPFHRLNKALVNPFEERAEFKDLAEPPKDTEQVYRTFCGT